MNRNTHNYTNNGPNAYKNAANWNGYANVDANGNNGAGNNTLGGNIAS